mmetsp:Transcript_58195/g.125815  ORF Transcript_58195/g.125815 Transcript_58195/m.125815 type:complete len:334 (+) Transcript_58195:128-1129(+)
MTLALYEKNCIFFRFASDATLEKIDFEGREIAVGDLKQAIADRKCLPRFDLVILNEATNEVYVKDGAMLGKNMTVRVRRTPLLNSKKPSVLHVDNVDIWSKRSAEGQVKEEKVQAPIQRRACPLEYLCPLCRQMFDDPCIARCCGKSACAGCFAARAERAETEECPLCGKQGDNGKPIPNPRLADCVASLDLSYFILPGEEEAARAAKKAEEAKAAEARRRSGPPPQLPNFWGSLPPSPWGMPHPASPHAGQGHGVPALHKVALTKEQFEAWQRSVADADSESDSTRNRRRGRRREKVDKKSKHAKRKRRRSGGSESGSEDGEKRKSKRRRLG